ncbi:MAG TPA: DoxX family protein [Terracidiphilus sp.]|nr:DoxX family protein [Terracidiphilus sp.]
MAQASNKREAWGLLLLRLLVGWVFLSEGIQKFLFPLALGAGRFQKIGIPAPAFTGPFVGIVECVCGALLIVGFFTAIAAIPLLFVIATAIATTKVPMLMHQGFWACMHEGRTDFCMLFGLVAILLLGAGSLSLDEFRSHA